MIISLKTNSSTKELDNLRSFAPTNIHKSHRRNSPTRPSFSKLLWTDEDIHSASFFIDLMKEWLRKIPHSCDESFCFTELHEFCIISDVDHTKIVAISCFKSYFSILSLQILNMEMRSWCCAVEHFLEEISIELINIIYSSSLRKWLFYCSKVITKEWSILSYNTILPSENIFDRLFCLFFFRKETLEKL